MALGVPAWQVRQPLDLQRPTAEAIDTALILGAVAMEHLHRDHLPGLAIKGQPDLGEAALADHLAQPVAVGQDLSLAQLRPLPLQALDAAYPFTPIAPELA